jgi:hypothetical protein
MAGTPMGRIKAKLGLKGKTKPGEMITRMNKMTMKQWESSSMDKALDKKNGYKEGSKEDNAADRKALAAYNSKQRNSKTKRNRLSKLAII